MYFIAQNKNKKEDNKKKWMDYFAAKYWIITPALLFVIVLMHSLSVSPWYWFPREFNVIWRTRQSVCVHVLLTSCFLSSRTVPGLWHRSWRTPPLFSYYIGRLWRHNPCFRDPFPSGISDIVPSVKGTLYVVTDLALQLIRSSVLVFLCDLL